MFLQGFQNLVGFYIIVDFILLWILYYCGFYIIVDFIYLQGFENLAGCENIFISFDEY